MAKQIVVLPSDVNTTEGQNGTILFSGQLNPAHLFKVNSQEVVVCVPEALQHDPLGNDPRPIYPVTLRTRCNGMFICTGGPSTADKAYTTSPIDSGLIEDWYSRMKATDRGVYVE